jgi:hypothetical protein
MSTQRKRKVGGVGERVNARPIVAAFTHDEVYLLLLAAKAYAASLDIVDSCHPDPELRSDAATLRELAALLGTANSARPFIEGEES